MLWLAIASPIPFLTLAPADRFRVIVRGADGTFEGLQLLAFAAASAGVVHSLLPSFRSWWATLVLVAAASLVTLGTAILYVR